MPEMDAPWVGTFTGWKGIRVRFGSGKVLGGDESYHIVSCL